MLAVALATLAGCTSTDDQRAGPPHEANGPPAVRDVTYLGFQGCEQYGVPIAGDSATLRSMVPSQYVWASELPVTNIATMYFLCELVVADNHTVESPATFMVASIAIDAPPGNETAANSYAILALTGSELVHRTLAAWGFPIERGELRWTATEAGRRLEIEGSDGTDFTLNMVAERDPGTATESATLRFHADATWVDLGYSLRPGPQPGAVVLDLDGGSVAQAAIKAPTGHAASVGTRSTGSFAITLGR